MSPVCQNCGTPRREGAVYCHNCGALLTPVNDSCGNCGADWVEGADFCVRCGTHRTQALAKGSPAEDQAPIPPHVSHEGRPAVTRHEPAMPPMAAPAAPPIEVQAPTPPTTPLYHTPAADTTENPDSVRPAGKVRNPALVALLLVVTINIYWVFWLYRTYKEIRAHSPGVTEVTPGRAAGFLFIPIFNFIWFMRLVGDLTRSVRAVQTGHPLGDQPLNTGLASTLLYLGFGINIVANFALDEVDSTFLAFFAVGEALLVTGFVVVQGALNSHWRRHADPTAGPGAGLTPATASMVSSPPTPVGEGAPAVAGIDEDYVRLCLTPAYREEPEVRNWRSDPAFRRVLDPLNQGDLTVAADEAEKLTHAFPDLDLAYTWWGSALIRSGQHARARDVLEQGVERARRKFLICEKLGEAEWRLGDIRNAVYWWAQSVHCQDTVDTSEVGAYLYLHYVADGMGSGEVAMAFARRVDMIAPGQVRLDSGTAADLRKLAGQRGTPAIDRVLDGLRVRYLS